MLEQVAARLREMPKEGREIKSERFPSAALRGTFPAIKGDE